MRRAPFARPPTRGDGADSGSEVAGAGDTSDGASLDNVLCGLGRADGVDVAVSVPRAAVL
jgi:hypothetical protein